MNGIWIKDQNGILRCGAQAFAKYDGWGGALRPRIRLAYDCGVERGWEWEDVAEYTTEAARDSAWQMLEKAIATGVRLFRFPTQEEIEKEEREE